MMVVIWGSMGVLKKNNKKNTHTWRRWFIWIRLVSLFDQAGPQLSMWCSLCPCHEEYNMYRKPNMVVAWWKLGRKSSLVYVLYYIIDGFTLMIFDTICEHIYKKASPISWPLQASSIIKLNMPKKKHHL